MKPVDFPVKPWEKLAMDIVGPIEQGINECKYAITLLDYHSKWPEVCFTSSVTTSKVISFLKTVFSREGYPGEIVTDNGVQFTSEEFRLFLSKRVIKHTFSSLYYPQCNGAIERFNRVLKKTVYKIVSILVVKIGN